MSNEGIILFEAGCKLVRQRIKQGLKPHVRVEVRHWKQWHTVHILARLENHDGWQDVAMTSEPVKDKHSRSWDATALAMWKLIEIEGELVRHVDLSKHLMHLMFIYTLHISDVRLKRDLLP